MGVKPPDPHFHTVSLFQQKQICTQSKKKVEKPFSKETSILPYFSSAAVFREAFGTLFASTFLALTTLYIELDVVYFLEGHRSNICICASIRAQTSTNTVFTPLCMRILSIDEYASQCPPCPREHRQIVRVSSFGVVFVFVYFLLPLLLFLRLIMAKENHTLKHTIHHVSSIGTIVLSLTFVKR